MRTALICHHDNALNREVLPRWLASFSDLAGVVVITETKERSRRRLRFELKRSGARILDVLAFQVVYRLRSAGADRAWVRKTVERLEASYAAVSGDVPVHHTHDPNDEGTRAFLEGLECDLVLARCKSLLVPAVFNAPELGTVVLHPGICPEYRNAHGCFWALARRDLDRVGATLLRIDEGVDTGPIFAYYTADIDELRESHVVIQHRVVFDNLDRVAADLQRLERGELAPIDTTGRTSAAWGQPRLLDYLAWKRAARRRAQA
jgi:folate-dependent phosphoribosylglycinamide formyltransferase PurN